MPPILCTELVCDNGARLFENITERNMFGDHGSVQTLYHVNYHVSRSWQYYKAVKKQGHEWFSKALELSMFLTTANGTRADINGFS